MSIGNYRVIQEIGCGGMAYVFLAEDPKFHTEVAVKVLNKEFIHNEHIRKRFLAEARSMFRMSHPNIIKVTDLIDEEDTVAFVMEYVEGETLKEYLERKGKLNDVEIKEIFSQMLDAVGYVHEQNLVHRDIKPSNFMLDKKGKVKLMDFGIAKNTDASSAEYTQTGTGMQMGTPMYMSPEQITETKSVTAQSDIYSLGVVLWQMVAGEKPYDAKTLSNFQLQSKIVNEPLPKTNTKWDNSIQKATSKVQSARFQTCLEFKNSLIKTPEQEKNKKEYQNIENLVDQTIFESKAIQEKSSPESTKNRTNEDTKNQDNEIKEDKDYARGGVTPKLEVELNNDYRFGELIFKEFEKRNIPKVLIYVFYFSNILLVIGLVSVFYYAYFSEDYIYIKINVEWNDIDNQELNQNAEALMNNSISEEIFIDDYPMPVIVDDELIEPVERGKAISTYNKITYISTIIPLISLFFNALFLVLLTFWFNKRQNILFLNIGISFLTGLYMFSWFFGSDLHWLIDGLMGFGPFLKSFAPLFSIIISLILNYKLFKSNYGL